MEYRQFLSLVAGTVLVCMITVLGLQAHHLQKTQTDGDPFPTEPLYLVEHLG